ncbi:UDP-N-acetylmuramoyl-tripeptide--D-alanyl-D-alanine ligase [Paludifilum halophilum]|uniref:UDP-N-acetylmuramoyl-tripeptide--D-alanyl-D-alanine ligase n=1 Tax=Paludifilum halophilum TaxID=1642702 RepID=A0A235BB85_9BACL|nr:UDP-N-acetylmuramoyl-tripeptide--D-alanyl-D-alanine ligase [Paludifilum halophilum]OYD09553.1 hypothetical protein CHM34_00605 [Paludifilum halophilum]
MGGSLIRGTADRLVRSANLGKSKYLRSNQIYFYSKSKSWNRQLEALRRIRPIAAVVPEHLSSSLPSGVAVITHRNIPSAYWKLALWNMKKVPVRVVAVTGSAGKSTTTEMIHSILRQRLRTVKTQGNLNTFTFLPSYLLRLKPGDHLLLLEMGMKSLNNIARQCRVVRPQVGAVTNVGEAHVGSLGSLDAIVRAKQELVEGMRPGGTLFLNADCPGSKKLSTKRFRGTRKTFGITNPANLRAENVKYTNTGMTFDVLLDGRKHSFSIPTWGHHNVYNALAAIGIARSLDFSVSQIQRGLARVRLPKMRFQVIRGKSGRRLINDAWNANPSAMKAGLTVLHNMSDNRPTVAVLGNMLELGRYSRWAHQKVGQHAAKLRLKQLVTYGQLAKEIGRTAVANGMDSNKVFHFTNRSALIRHLKQTPEQSIIYFKASRKLHLEKVIDQLKHLR